MSDINILLWRHGNQIDINETQQRAAGQVETEDIEDNEDNEESMSLLSSISSISSVSNSG